ncbi:MAG TPA: hypothetical protein VFK54_08060 [Candidatus Limnocylindrales bacterium]|nr:hypothetical protein [Candidatus Limnocylindrales bacterium]
MTEAERRVRSDSDELLSAIEHLRRLEQRKRSEHISTPGFHELADEVALQARHVFDVASRENADADRAATTDVSIEETPPLPASGKVS